MIEFILNDRLVRTAAPAMMPLLDFIRTEQGLMATKTGCREGDCGACLVLEGRLENGHVHYQSIVSCLTPLGNVAGKHILTLEGIQTGLQTPVQKALVSNAAIQCGFCTPGIVMALTGLCLSEKTITPELAIQALDGNLCRCTGYQSLKAAAREIVAGLPPEPEKRTLSWLALKGYLPAYFDKIPERLAQLPHPQEPLQAGRPTLGGGTDLMVQRADALLPATLNFFRDNRKLSGIWVENSQCTIGSAATMSQILEHPVLMAHLPGLERVESLIASTPIRNMGTLGGNLVNASPIADLTIFFLALEPTILIGGESYREMPLGDFYLGYKKVALLPEEYVSGIRFQLPGPDDFVHFEKVSKRQHLDIASVNTAIKLNTDGKTIQHAVLSAGGVSPVPLVLAKTSAFLKGKPVSADILKQANDILQTEISPIDDIRGSARYKRLLLRQLFYAHFFGRFQDKLSLSGLTP